MRIEMRARDARGRAKGERSPTSYFEVTFSFFVGVL